MVGVVNWRVLSRGELDDHVARRLCAGLGGGAGAVVEGADAAAAVAGQAPVAARAFAHGASARRPGPFLRIRRRANLPLGRRAPRDRAAPPRGLPAPRGPLRRAV